MWPCAISLATRPDHDTICTFRRANFEVVSEAFLQVLQLAKELKLLQVGTVSVDGTHLRANARKDQNVSYERARQLQALLEEDVKALLEQAEKADRQEQADPGNLPEEIGRWERLGKKMRAAQAQLESPTQARTEAERAEYEAKLQAPEKRGGKGPAPQAHFSNLASSQQGQAYNHKFAGSGI